MNLMRTLRKIWLWLPPQTWTEAYIVIGTLLLIFLAAAFILDMLKGALP